MFSPCFQDSFKVGVSKLELDLEMRSESKGSPSSPGDSGVALFDSDDNTSEIVTDKTEVSLFYPINRFYLLCLSVEFVCLHTFEDIFSQWASAKLNVEW